MKGICERNVFKLIFMFDQSVDVKLCKFNVLDNPASPQRSDSPRYSHRCNIERLQPCVRLKRRWQPYLIY